MAIAAPYRLDVDGVFCISLREREDRRELVRHEFRYFDHAIEFVLVERDSDNPERGCYRSHQRCARLALDRGYRRVLLLEDDATFLAPVDGQIGRINRFLSWRNPRLFYLGGILGRMWATPWRNIVRCRLNGTQAYILSRRGCEILLAHDYADIPVDKFYRRAMRAYGTYPMLSQQQPEEISASDIYAFRHEKGGTHVKDVAFWAANFEGQRSNLRRHWLRTVLLRY